MLNVLFYQMDSYQYVYGLVKQIDNQMNHFLFRPKCSYREIEADIYTFL